MSPDGAHTPDRGFGPALAERVRPRSRTIARRTVGAAPGRLAGRMVDFAGAVGVAPLARLEMEHGTLAAPGGASVRPPLDPWLWGPEDDVAETQGVAAWQPARSPVRRTPRRGLPLTTRRRNRTVGGAGTAPGAIARRMTPGAETAPADPVELIARSRGRVPANRPAPAPAASRPRPRTEAPAATEPPAGLPSDLERLRRMLVRDGKLSDSTPGEMGPPPGRPDLRPSAAPGAPSGTPVPSDTAPTATDARASAAGSIDRATVANARRARPEAGPVRRTPQPDAVGRDVAAPGPRPGRGGEDISTRPPSMWLGEADPAGGASAPSASPARSGSVDPAALASVIRRRDARPQPVRPVPAASAPGRPDISASSSVAERGDGSLRSSAPPGGPAPVMRRSPVADAVAERRPTPARPIGVLDPDDADTAGSALVDLGPAETARTQTARTEAARTEAARTEAARTEAARTHTARTDTRAPAAFAETPTEWAVAPPPLAGALGSTAAQSGTAPAPAPARSTSPPVVRRLAEVAPSIAEVRASADRADTAPSTDGRVAPDRVAASPSVVEGRVAPDRSAASPSVAEGRVASDRVASSPSVVEGRVASDRVAASPSVAEGRVASDRPDTIPSRIDRSVLPGRPGAAPSTVVTGPDADRSAAPVMSRDGSIGRPSERASIAPRIPIDDLPVRPAVASPGPADATVRRQSDASQPTSHDPSIGTRPRPVPAVREEPASVTAADLRRIAARADRPVPLSRDDAAAVIARAPGRRIAASDLTVQTPLAPNVAPVAARPDAPVRRTVLGDVPTVASPGGVVAPFVERAATADNPSAVNPSAIDRGRLMPTAALPVRMAAPAGPPTPAGEAGRVTRGVLRRTVADMPLRRRHEPLAAAVAGAAAQHDDGVVAQLAADGRDAPIAERFMTELSRRRTPRPAPLPERLRPMSDLITGGVTARVATDRISRQALRSVGKVAATVGDTIHLDRPVHQVPTEVLAHELTHVAHPSPTPRFFDDDRPSIEERRADAIGKLMRSTAPSVIRRAPADDAPGAATGTISAAALADQLTSGGGGATIRRWNSATPKGTSRSGAPATTDRSGGRGSGGAPSTPPAQQAVAPPPVAPAVVAAPEPATSAEASAPDLVSQFDRILELLEERVLRELERRGGRLRGGF